MSLVRGPRGSQPTTPDLSPPHGTPLSPKQKNSAQIQLPHGTAASTTQHGTSKTASTWGLALFYYFPSNYDVCVFGQFPHGTAAAPNNKDQTQLTTSALLTQRQRLFEVVFTHNSEDASPMARRQSD